MLLATVLTNAGSSAAHAASDLGEHNQQDRYGMVDPKKPVAAVMRDGQMALTVGWVGASFEVARFVWTAFLTG